MGLHTEPAPDGCASFPPSVSYVCTNHGLPGELSSVRDEKDTAMVRGAEVYKIDVLFQM